MDLCPFKINDYLEMVPIQRHFLLGNVFPSCLFNDINDIVYIYNYIHYSILYFISKSFLTEIFFLMSCKSLNIQLKYPELLIFL